MTVNGDKPRRNRERPFVWITLAVLAVIVYGSLYPFDFRPRGTWTGAVTYLLSTPFASPDRGDILSNVLLYLPLGLFAARALRRIRPTPRVLIVAGAAGLLSASIEIIQFWDFTRAPELSDVAANLGGALVGATAELFLRADRFPRMKWRPFTMLLVVCAAGWFLSPFIPALRPIHYARALRILTVAPPFEPLIIFKFLVIWLALATLLHALFGVRSKAILPPAIAVALLARFANPFLPLTRAEILGAILAAILWIAFFEKTPARVKIVAAAFAAYVFLDALRPFTFLSDPRAFGWSPFLAFMNGPRGYATQVFLEKTFTYGTLVWLFAESGLSFARATLLAVVLVTVSRVAQMWLPGRSAELTDPLMVLIVAGVFKLIGD